MPQDETQVDSYLVFMWKERVEEIMRMEEKKNTDIQTDGIG